MAINCARCSCRFTHANIYDKLIIRTRGSANTHLWQPERYTHSGMTNAQIRRTHVYMSTHTRTHVYIYIQSVYVTANVRIRGILRPFLANQWEKIYLRHLEMSRVFIANDRIFSWCAREVRRQEG